MPLNRPSSIPPPPPAPPRKNEQLRPAAKSKYEQAREVVKRIHNKLTSLKEKIGESLTGKQNRMKRMKLKPPPPPPLRRAERLQREAASAKAEYEQASQAAAGAEEQIARLKAKRERLVTYRTARDRAYTQALGKMGPRPPRPPRRKGMPTGLPPPPPFPQQQDTLKQEARQAKQEYKKSSQAVAGVEGEIARLEKLTTERVAKYRAYLALGPIKTQDLLSRLQEPLVPNADPETVKRNIRNTAQNSNLTLGAGGSAMDIAAAKAGIDPSDVDPESTTKTDVDIKAK